MQSNSITNKEQLPNHRLCIFVVFKGIISRSSGEGCWFLTMVELKDGLLKSTIEFNVYIIKGIKSIFLQLKDMFGDRPHQSMKITCIINLFWERGGGMNKKPLRT